MARGMMSHDGPSHRHRASFHESISEIAVGIQHTDLGYLGGHQPPLVAYGPHQIVRLENGRGIQRVVQQRQLCPPR